MNLKISDNKITGLLVAAKERSPKTLITTMPMVEVGTYFSIGSLLPELKWASEAAVNAKNADKVQAIQAELENVVTYNTANPPLSLTFVVIGKPHLAKASQFLSTLRYSSSNTCIVGNVLGLVAVCKVLGVKTFLFSSRLSAKEASQKSELRQRLAMEYVEVRIIFDDEQGLDGKHAVELFKKSSIFDSSLNLPHLNEGENLLPDDQFPLKRYIDKLINDAELDYFGGVSFDSKHVKVSGSNITTQYILFKTIVGAVAGIGTQEYSKMSKDISLPNGATLTSILSGGYINKITVFFKAWLEELKDEFVDNRSGYHLSPQVWQALGLTIHQLVNYGASNEDLKIAGKVLGQLSYRKNAKHWSNCSVMELDSKGRLYKNAASSTRQFRVGLFEYFFEHLERLPPKG